MAAFAAIALLLAQLGALSHTYSHDRSAAHQSGATLRSGLCDDCLAYAPVLSGTGTQGALPCLEALRPGHGPEAAARSGVDLPRNLAFRSRAPPTIPASV